jgi:TubC N-terminal docking domain
MSASTFLDSLAAYDVLVWADGAALAYDAPAGAITPELLSGLRAHKSELLALSRDESAELEPDGSNCRHVLKEEGQYTSSEEIEWSTDITFFRLARSTTCAVCIAVAAIR